MALAARTAPKGKGVDTIIIRVLTGKEIKKLASHLHKQGKKREIGFFQRDAANIDQSDAVVLIGARGNESVGLNCGACGFPTCVEMTDKFRANDEVTTDFAGPNCSIRMADLGIAVGSAVKTAQIHNVDNRVMFSGGTAALDLGYLGDGCTIAYAVPLSATGKNIFFDRESRPGPAKKK